MTPPTHCIMYNPIDRFDPTETSGTCIDTFTPDGDYCKCMDAINQKKCRKGRKTPVNR